MGKLVHFFRILSSFLISRQLVRREDMRFNGDEMTDGRESDRMSNDRRGRSDLLDLYRPLQAYPPAQTDNYCKGKRLGKWMMPKKI